MISERNLRVLEFNRIREMLAEEMEKYGQDCVLNKL